jgi:hypothetical protein
MTPEEIEKRLDIASSTILEMLQWDPENVRKKEQLKKYLRGFLLEGI